MCVYVHVLYVFLCMCLFVHVYPYMFVYVCVFLCLRVCVCVMVRVCVYAFRMECVCGQRDYFVCLNKHQLEEQTHSISDVKQLVTPLISTNVLSAVETYSVSLFQKECGKNEIPLKQDFRLPNGEFLTFLCIREGHSSLGRASSLDQDAENVASWLSLYTSWCR